VLGIKPRAVLGKHFTLEPHQPRTIVLISISLVIVKAEFGSAFNLGLFSVNCLLVPFLQFPLEWLFFFYFMGVLYRF
jgi:hypothetical protein